MFAALLSYSVRSKAIPKEDANFPPLPRSSYHNIESTKHATRRYVAVDDLATNGLFCEPCKNLLSWLSEQDTDFSVDSITSLVKNNCTESWCSTARMFLIRDHAQLFSEALLKGQIAQFCGYYRFC